MDLPIETVECPNDPAGAVASIATPLWPPAAIALVSALVWGRWAALGPGLGSFGVNLSIAGSFSDWPTSLLAGAGISLGAFAQTEVGRRLAQHYLPGPLLLDHVSDVARFMLLVGPLTCLVNATCGNLTLLGLGLIEPAQVELGWLT